MLSFLKRPLYVLSNKIHRRHRPEKLPEEKWVPGFSKLENFPFDIKPESSYDAYPAGNLPKPQSAGAERGGSIPDTNSLGLALKKENHIAWIEAPARSYQDQIIEARLLLDSLGGYAAAGIVFRIVDDGTYYLALVSSKGYFRLDAVKNGTPLPLVGWTETPVIDERVAKGDLRDQNDLPAAINLTIIACGEDMFFLVNGRWIAEISDDSSSEGRIGFALASYEVPSKNKSARTKTAQTGAAENSAHTCRAWLDYLSVDSRSKYVESHYQEWKDSKAIPAEYRIRLAETFAAMDAAVPALAQITRVWEQREEAARSVTATYTEMRRRRELLIAARMARRLERYEEAEEYINACLDQGRDNPEGEKAITEKTKILVASEKYPELREFMREQIVRQEDDPALHALLGHAHWNLKEYEDAATAWDKAFELDRENGLYAVNAANAYILLNKNEEALNRCLEGGKIFLRQGNSEEMDALMPKLLSLGERCWEARALAGKWAFGAGDFDRAESELILAEGVRRKQKPLPPPDPAVSYLRGLLLVNKGKLREALRFLMEAVRLAPDYGLFHFKLAETRYLFSGSVRTPGLAANLKAALSLMPDDGWVHNFAAQFLIARNSSRAGDLAAAEQHLQKAAAILGEIPAVKVNQAALCCQRGSLAKALKILDAGTEDDPEGLMAHCAGNLLFRSGDFERAGAFYRKALDIAPDNVEYLSSRINCLIALKLFAQAEELLIQARSRNPSPAILKLIKHLHSKQKPVRGHAAASKPTAKTKPKPKPEVAEITHKAAMPQKNQPKAAKPAHGPARPRKSQAEAAEPARKPGRPRKNPPKV